MTLTKMIRRSNSISAAMCIDSKTQGAVVILCSSSDGVTYTYQPRGAYMAAFLIPLHNPLHPATSCGSGTAFILTLSPHAVMSYTTHPPRSNAYEKDRTRRGVLHCMPKAMRPARVTLISEGDYSGHLASSLMRPRAFPFAGRLRPCGRKSML